MKLILRPFLVLAVLIAASAGLVACGGGDDGGDGGGGGAGGVSEGTNVNDVLTKAFDASADIEKGVLSVSAKGTVSGQSGEFTLSGPFESQGEGKLPKLDMELTASAAGQDIKAGIVHTGTKAFVSCELEGIDGCDGSSYVVDDATYKQFVQSFEQAARQSESQGAGSLDELGIDPASWLRDPRNEGDSEVEGTDTVKVAGDVDVPKLLADVNTLISKAGSLGLSGQANVPDQLTDEQIRQAQDAISKLSIEVEAGKDDSALRRMFVDVAAKDPDSDESGNGTLEIKLSEVGEDQEFEEPGDAKPLQELLGQVGGLGALGGGASGGASSGGASSQEQQQQLEEYSQCIEDAGSDTAQAQECASQLG